MKRLAQAFARFGRGAIADPRRVARWTAGVFVAYFAGFNLWRFYTFQLGGDWCMIANSVAATARGEFFASRVAGGPPFCFWEQHITWLLFVYVPFFWIHPTLGSVVMLITQAAAIGFAGWLLFLLARRWLGGDWGGWLAMLLLFANWRIQKALVHDYHMLTTLPAFLMLALYLAERRRWRAMWLVFAAGLLVREDAFFSMMAVPLYVGWARRRWVQAAGMAVLAAAYAGVLFGVVYPHIRHGQSAYQFVSHYAWLGDSIPAIARRLLLEPHRVLWALLTERDNRQLLILLGQLAYLPLFSIRGWLVGLPGMTESLLSRSAFLTGYAYHYVVPPAGALTVAALYTLRGWRARRGGACRSSCSRWRRSRMGSTRWSEGCCPCRNTPVASRPPSRSRNTAASGAWQICGRSRRSTPASATA